MGKSNWRLNFISKSVLSRVFKESVGISLKKKKSIIFSKNSVIPKALIGINFFIHKGLKFRELKLNNYHIGFKFGEFILTRKPHFFKKKGKKVSKNYKY